MAQGDAYGCRTQFRDHGRVWTVTQYYQDTQGIDEREAANDLVDAYDRDIGPALDACRAVDSTREGHYGWKQIAGTGMPAKNSQQSTAGTSGESESTSPNNCAVITLQTFDPSAVRQGRIYLAGIPRTWIEGGRWNAAAMAALDNLAGLVATPIVGALGIWTPIILRRVKDGQKLPAPEQSPVNAANATNVIYTQRRRNSRQLGTG